MNLLCPTTKPTSLRKLSGLISQAGRIKVEGPDKKGMAFEALYKIFGRAWCYTGLPSSLYTPCLALFPRPSPRYYLTPVEKNKQGCEIKFGRRPWSGVCSCSIMQSLI